MIYLTGKHALALPCPLETPGRVPDEPLDWSDVVVGDSELAFFGEYGLIPEEDIPGRPDVQYVADHIRVCLDYLEQGDFELVRGMNREILGAGWRDEVFERVLEMRVAPNWNEIDAFMQEEYGEAWTVAMLEKGTGEL